MKQQRIIDTFAARDIHYLSQKPSVYEFIKYGISTGYGLTMLRKKKKNKKYNKNVKEKNIEQD